jgi:DNA-binding NtrC family response regulator
MIRRWSKFIRKISLRRNFKQAAQAIEWKLWKFCGIHHKQFDRLIGDNEMPKMDGIALLRRVRQEFPKLKVVIVAGYGNWRDYVDAYNPGVMKFLDKPIRMKELRKLVRSTAH